MRKLQAAWLQEVRFFQEMVLFSKKKKKLKKIGVIIERVMK